MKNDISSSLATDETVREVCDLIRIPLMDLYATNDELDDRILAAHERELVAKDAEIARLKAALKTVMECDSDFDSCAWMGDQLDEEQMDAVDGLHTAVREAKRVMRESANGESK